MSDPYYSESDELGVLGCCFRGDLTILSDIAASFQPVMLFNDPVRDSYELSLILLSENQRTTTASMERLWAKTHGNRPAPKEVWSKAMSAIPSASNHPFYVQGVRDAFRRRKLRDAAVKMNHATSDKTKTPEAIIAELEEGIALEADKVVTSCDSKTAMRGYIDDLKHRFNNKGKMSGIPTGFWKLDSMTDGLQFREMFVLGARPSIGKTAIAMNIVRHACIEKRFPTLVVSCEMSQNALIRRLMADLCETPIHLLKSMELNDRQFLAQFSQSKLVGEAPIHWHDSSKGEPIDVVCAAIRSNVRRYGVKLIVVDYLQKILPSTRNEKRTYEVGEVSMKLKAVAASTGVALLCLAQLNRDTEKEKGRPPRLGDLGDSKQIEQDADVVALLDRKRGEKEGEATLAIAKQRDGECGLIPLKFQGQFCRFSTRGPEID